MRLWLLGRSGMGYDKTMGMVVRARNEKQARQLAGEDDGDKEWLDSKKTTCESLGARGDAGVIIRDYQDG